MIEDSYLYLALDLFSFLSPFVFSFEKSRVYFISKWKYIAPGILVMMAVFIPWDIFFTQQGIWGFNSRYLIGLSFLKLPIEEWLFFIVVPLACVFVYEAMNYLLKTDYLKPYATIIALTIAAVNALVGILYFNHTYTSAAFLLNAGLLILHVSVIKSTWLGRFFVGYLVSLIPFLMINGVLTGSFVEEPVVWYNNQHNLGIRIFTIPVEDSMYMMAMLLIVTSVYERLKNILS